MFSINSDKTINVTRGDTAVFSVSAKTGNTDYSFKVGDVIRLKIFAKKDCSDVVLIKDTAVSEETSAVEISLDSKDTKLGEIINKPKDYWYEVELNPETKPQTIVGYDENGAKIFRLYPEGGVINE